jgi:pimeloyl-ACP methyl ester carboxylesterase
MLKRLMMLTVLQVSGAMGAVYAQSHPVPPSQAMPAVRFTQTLGETIAYYELGEGPALVLIHGSGVSAAIDWGQVIRSLSQHYRVIALDLIGHGQSSKPNLAYTYETYVSFVGEFLQDLGITHCYLAGESMGGGIVTLYAIEAAQPGSGLPKVDKLVITDGAVPVPGKWPPAPGPQAAANLYRSTGHGVATWQDYKTLLNRGLFVDPSYATDEYAKDAWKLVMSYQNGAAQWLAAPPDSPAALAVNALYQEHLKDIKAPTLIVWGENDVLIPVANTEYIHGAIAGSRVLVYPKTGHAPAVEHPQKYVEDVRRFLDGR